MVLEKSLLCGVRCRVTACRSLPGALVRSSRVPEGVVDLLFVVGIDIVILYC